MELVELDLALEELELRLERLRALYEQYFLGLEKIEPAVARKDVDRRIYVLRREKIRNTAKRFKLQTIIQRYNTFQQYWQRICREIENGTYKRHLLRAQKAGGEGLLTIAARRRLGRARRSSAPPEGSQVPASASASPSAPAAPASASAPASPLLPPPAPPTTARPLGSPPLPRLRPPLPGAAASVPAPAAFPPAAAAPAKFESLDLDMDFMGDWDPTARRANAQAKPPSPPKPAGVVPGQPLPATAKPAAPSPARPAAQLSVPLSPKLGPAPAPAQRVAPPAASKQPAATPPATAPTLPQRATPAGTPPLKPAAKAAVPPAPTQASGVDETRIRDLHARLQQAKQQTKEGAVSFEGLARSIRAAEAKLREQHKNRKIDFDIVIKDGKAVVKPIVR